MNKPETLKAQYIVELIPAAPFNFDATLHKPDHFPAADTRWEPGTRWQTMRWQGQPLGLRFKNQGNAVTEQELRALKVGYRAKSIKRVTAALAGQDVDEFELRSQSREEQRQALLNLYGIGPASVGYILFDVFHHMNELEYICWPSTTFGKTCSGSERTSTSSG
jgi:hypothetical protein